jgi:transposase InsO family protein
MASGRSDGSRSGTGSRFIGWRASRTAHAGFVPDAPEQAVPERRPVRDGGLVHHSDRGVQCVSVKYAEAGIEPAVGSVGDSYDSALPETANGLFEIGLYKAEVTHWRGFEAVGFATLEGGDWCNKRRPLGPIGNTPAAEAETAPTMLGLR